jgi:hypothetical protein
MRYLRSFAVSLLLVFASLGMVASTPSQAEAYHYRWYGAHHYPYYWQGGYYNPYQAYGYQNWYGAYGVNPYYTWYRAYPWGWYW